MKPRLPARLAAALASVAVVSAAAAQAPTPPSAPPAEKRAEASPEAVRKGKALFARVIESLGGREKIARVHDIQTRGLVSARTPQGEMTMDVQTAMIFPDRISQQVDAPFGRLAMVATPGGAFIVGPNAVQDLPPGMRDELLKQVRRVPLLLAQKADDPKLLVVSAGTERIGTIDAEVLDVTYGSALVRWLIDPASGRILRSAHTSMGPQGEAKIVSDYSDYRIVDGFPVAFHLEVKSNGEKDQTVALDECKINSGVDAKLFEKPAPPASGVSPPPAPLP